MKELFQEFATSGALMLGESFNVGVGWVGVFMYSYWLLCIYFVVIVSCLGVASGLQKAGYKI